MKKFLVVLLILIVIGVIVFFILKHLGIGFGKGNGAGDGGTASAAETAVSQEAEPAVTEVKYVEVSVKNDKYVYAGAEYNLDGLIAELKKLDSEINVRIKDDGGLVDARDALTAALDKENIPYTDDTAV